MFTDPTQNIRALNLQFGERFADLGCGSGFYSLAAARLLGPRGRVLAVDIKQSLLERLKEEAHRAKLNNIEVVWGDLEKVGGTKLRDSSVDAGVISNILFQLTDKKAVAEEAKRILRPGGRLLVVDWTDSFGNMGPEASAVVTREVAKKIFTDAGFVLSNEIPAGDHHYGLVFKKV